MNVDNSLGRPASKLLASLVAIKMCGAAHAEDSS